ncbi:hypothetical protein DDD63_06000 [Actinobaculum sp. 313]|nr:hypothetical protein DDD63_06000 [Actinobaculum sp. 313]
MVSRCRRLPWNVEEVNDWWTSLSPAQQQDIISNRPDWIGNLDGIPVNDRGAANLNRLNSEITAVDEEIAEKQTEFEGQGGPLDDPVYVKRAQQELHRLERKREELEQLRETFKNDSGRHTLVLLDATSGDHLQAAVAIGEEDFADHSVALSDQAEAGGERLAGFLDSLWSTHYGDPHLVASGHSYGSSVTGYALQETAAPDEFNALGSPGVSTNHLGPLHIIPGKFNVASTPGDGVAVIARFGGQPPVSEGHRIGTGGWISPEGIDYSPS